MSHREQVTRTVAIALSLVFLFVLLIAGAFYLRGYFQRQAVRQFQHSQHSLCVHNPGEC